MAASEDEKRGTYAPPTFFAIESSRCSAGSLSAGSQRCRCASIAPATAPAAAAFSPATIVSELIVPLALVRRSCRKSAYSDASSAADMAPPHPHPPPRADGARFDELTRAD